MRKDLVLWRHISFSGMHILGEREDMERPLSKGEDLTIYACTEDHTGKSIRDLNYWFPKGDPDWETYFKEAIKHSQEYKILEEGKKILSNKKD